MYGQLMPLGGGDPIPLMKKNLLIGRRESCDIVLRFANVSAHHCRLILVDGYWTVKDLESRNGTKVNGVQIEEKRIDPGDTLSIAKHHYEVRYSPLDLGAVGPPPSDEVGDILSESLLERSGLEKKLRGVRDEDLDDAHRAIVDAGVPVLAIWGETDEIIPLSCRDRLADLNPDAGQKVIEGAGHTLTYTHSDAVLEALGRVMDP